jgi:hypothetical protein
MPTIESTKERATKVRKERMDTKSRKTLNVLIIMDEYVMRI